MMMLASLFIIYFLLFIKRFLTICKFIYIFCVIMCDDAGIIIYYLFLFIYSTGIIRRFPLMDTNSSKIVLEDMSHCFPCSYAAYLIALHSTMCQSTIVYFNFDHGYDF